MKSNTNVQHSVRQYDGPMNKATLEISELLIGRGGGFVLNNYRNISDIYIQVKRNLEAR
jgi:hypothetical protein